MAKQNSLTFLLQNCLAEKFNSFELHYSADFEVDGLPEGGDTPIQFQSILKTNGIVTFCSELQIAILSPENNVLNTQCYFDYGSDELPDSAELLYRTFGNKKSFSAEPKIPASRGTIEVTVAPKSLLGSSKWQTAGFSVDTISVSNDDGDFNCDWSGETTTQGSKLLCLKVNSGKNQRNTEIFLNAPVISNQIWINGSTKLTLDFDIYEEASWSTHFEETKLEFKQIESESDDEDFISVDEKGEEECSSIEKFSNKRFLLFANEIPESIGNGDLHSIEDLHDRKLSDAKEIISKILSELIWAMSSRAVEGEYGLLTTDRKIIISSVPLNSGKKTQDYILPTGLISEKLADEFIEQVIAEGLLPVFVEANVEGDHWDYNFVKAVESFQAGLKIVGFYDNANGLIIQDYEYDGENVYLGEGYITEEIDKFRLENAFWFVGDHFEYKNFFSDTVIENIEITSNPSKNKPSNPKKEEITQSTSMAIFETGSLKEAEFSLSDFEAASTSSALSEINLVENEFKLGED